MLVSPSQLAVILSTVVATSSAETIRPETPTDPAVRRKIMNKATPLTPEQSRALSSNGSYTDYYATSSTFSNAFGFNPTSFSLSYSRCAQVQQFDDDRASEEGSNTAFATKHFAIFRFCPSTSCDPYAIVSRDEEEENAEVTAEQRWYNFNAEEGVEDERLYMNMDFETYQAYRTDKYASYSYVNEQNAQAARDNFEEISKGYTVGGANGSGCSSNYGEYMIELEDYLEIMQEAIQTRFEEYCTYCEECMYGEYQNWAQNQDGGARTLFAKSDEEWRHLEFERQLGGCAAYDTCRYYANTCNNGLDDTVTDYFQRKASGDYYLGPHCAEDGMSITLGAYSDANGDVYAGDVKTLTGETVDQEMVDIWSTGNMNALMPEGYQQVIYEETGGWETMCIPCSEVTASIVASYGEEVDGVDASTINPLCLNVYETSARCDHHYNNYQSKSKSIGLYDKEHMEMSCNYIDRAKMGTYDESGALYLTESPLVKYLPASLKESPYYDSAYPYISKVSGWQIFGLVASLLACVMLAAYSIKLHRSLTKKGQWRPVRKNRAVNSSMAQPVPNSSRVDSGIGMARGQSGNSYYMS